MKQLNQRCNEHDQDGRRQDDRVPLNADEVESMRFTFRDVTLTRMKRKLAKTQNDLSLYNFLWFDSFKTVTQGKKQTTKLDKGYKAQFTQQYKYFTRSNITNNTRMKLLS